MRFDRYVRHDMGFLLLAYRPGSVDHPELFKQLSRVLVPSCLLDVLRDLRDLSQSICQSSNETQLFGVSLKYQVEYAIIRIYARFDKVMAG